MIRAPVAVSDRHSPLGEDVRHHAGYGRLSVSPQHHDGEFRLGGVFKEIAAQEHGGHSGLVVLSSSGTEVNGQEQLSGPERGEEHNPSYDPAYVEALEDMLQRRLSEHSLSCFGEIDQRCVHDDADYGVYQKLNYQQQAAGPGRGPERPQCEHYCEHDRRRRDYHDETAQQRRSAAAVASSEGNGLHRHGHRLADDAGCRRAEVSGYPDLVEQVYERQIEGRVEDYAGQRAYADRFSTAHALHRGVHDRGHAADDVDDDQQRQDPRAVFAGAVKQPVQRFCKQDHPRREGDGYEQQDAQRLIQAVVYRLAVFPGVALGHERRDAADDAHRQRGDDHADPRRPGRLDAGDDLSLRIREAEPVEPHEYELHVDHAVDADRERDYDYRYAYGDEFPDDAAHREIVVLRIFIRTYLIAEGLVLGAYIDERGHRSQHRSGKGRIYADLYAEAHEPYGRERACEGDDDAHQLFYDLALRGYGDIFVALEQSPPHAQERHYQHAYGNDAYAPRDGLRPHAVGHIPEYIAGKSVGEKLHHGE